MTSITPPPGYKPPAYPRELQGENDYALGKSPFQSGYVLDSHDDKAWRRGWFKALRKSEGYRGS